MSDDKKSAQELNKMLREEKQKESGIPIDNDEMAKQPEDTDAKDQTKKPNEPDNVEPYNKKLYEPDPKNNK